MRKHSFSVRYECGVPVIIEGETGVGKTALVEMLSKLWNQGILDQWRKQKDQILDLLRRKLGDLTVDKAMDDYMVMCFYNQRILYTWSLSSGLQTCFHSYNYVSAVSQSVCVCTCKHVYWDDITCLV